ncbi:glutamine synthetase [Lewinella marina]|uniref:Glutamine synthetase n=1 Tax=Neolewinella marina TaxID=438751 RepID=A0A2G0CKG0_9BACT|nr:glutamine synthetase [Neolewinella marina]NJB84383.1 glutamine synthetase [Neolewinella marina]PHL00421.1 glutamine synthetase [Neolewinella marina]
MQTKPDLFGDNPALRVKIAAADIDGILRAKYISREKFDSAREKGFGFCNVIFGWDSQDVVYGNAAADPGFADARATIAEESGRQLPWEGNVPFFLADFRTDPGVAGVACPRSLLRRVVARAENMGFTPRFGPEYEWFTYRETPQSLAEKDFRSSTPLSPGMFGYSGLRTAQRSDLMQELFERLAAADIHLEGLHTETGPGVLEAAIAHREALEAADRAILFKQAVKEISYAHGLVSSFMAKPSGDLPGCGGHLHQSLWREGSNAFADPEGRYGMSQTFEAYLAGQLRLLPVLMPLFAPNVNSYKRYVAGSWAATRANWGVDNRTVALRVVPDGGDATRLETRVPGADANPYLAIAAALAAGLYGIKHGLKLEQEPVRGSAYEQSVGELLPRHLGAAAGALERSEEAAELLGTEFRDHFVTTRQWEWEQYLGAVTDWERRRYFELA